MSGSDVPLTRSPTEWGKFLIKTPPWSVKEVHGLLDVYHGTGWLLAAPELKLHCEEECRGLRTFRCTDDPRFMPLNDNISHRFLNYRCKDCEAGSKTYAVRLGPLDQDGSPTAVAVKIGEWPPFGGPLPSKLITLVREDRDLLTSGYRCEGQGLGIGAFAYYRRVVENEKNRLLDRIIDVARKVEADDVLIEELESAKTETQFQSAIEKIKKGIPQALLIDGNNPLILLHKALSKGLHAKTDAECLEGAQAIRLILTELADRSAQVLKDQSEILAALKKLQPEETKGDGEPREHEGGPAQ